MNKERITVQVWMEKACLIVTSKIWPKFRHPKEEGGFNDRLSEIATRNLSSWTFFTEGVRTEEKSL